MRIDLHAPARESRVDGVRVVQSTRGDDVMDAAEGPGISLQCDRMRKSSRSCPYGSASLVETVLMPKKNRHAMTMATQARPIASGVRLCGNQPVRRVHASLAWRSTRRFRTNAP